jgi:hypothetical protein
MTTKALRKELHQEIDKMSDDGFLQIVHAMFKQYAIIYESDYVLSEIQIGELAEQKRLYKAGKLKTYPVSEVRKRALSKLRK